MRAAAAEAEPSLNAWYNASGAAASICPLTLASLRRMEGGLLVPVLRNVAERDAKDLRAGLDRMRADAAARSIPSEELRGATITLSNFGIIGTLCKSRRSCVPAGRDSGRRAGRARMLRMTAACRAARVPLSLLSITALSQVVAA